MVTRGSWTDNSARRWRDQSVCGLVKISFSARPNHSSSIALEVAPPAESEELWPATSIQNHPPSEPALQWQRLCRARCPIRLSDILLPARFATSHAAREIAALVGLQHFSGWALSEFPDLTLPIHRRLDVRNIRQLKPITFPRKADL